jgi:hypothetical protein
MNDDWRLRVSFRAESTARELTDRLEAFDLEHDLKSTFPDRVIVSRDVDQVFCYTATREQAEAAEKVIRSLAAEHRWELDTQLKHWHPSAEDWEDPDKALPQTDADRAAERARLMESEREESEAQGYPDYEVRVRCESQDDALRLQERLRAEGIPSVQRWQFVVVGAADEDSANGLAERIRRDAPQGSTVTAEGSVAEISEEAPFATPFRNPFAVFGGLAG